jgi:hypothetical protein
VRPPCRKWVGCHLAEGGGDERRGGHRGVGEDRRVGEELPQAVGEAGVEHPDHQAQPGFDLLRAERGVHVAHVVLVQQGQPVRPGQAGPAEGVLVEPVGPDHLDPVDVPPVGALGAAAFRHHQGDPDPAVGQVGAQQRPHHPVRQRVVAADHVVRTGVAVHP